VLVFRPLPKRKFTDLRKTARADASTHRLDSFSVPREECILCPLLVNLIYALFTPWQDAAVRFRLFHCWLAPELEFTFLDLVRSWQVASVSLFALQAAEVSFMSTEPGLSQRKRKFLHEGHDTVRASSNMHDSCWRSS